MKKYYRLNKILSHDCQYNIIIGQRSNGKTYACLENALKEYVESGKQFAIIRRFREDFRAKRAASLFDGLVANKVVTKLTKGEYTNIIYNSSRWYFAKYDSDLDKMVLSENPCAYAFTLSEMEHDKSSSYPNIKNIIFDEFLTRSIYLQDEFVIFMNVLSTIIRDNTDVRIFMLGNTVNKYCPYFAEMGLNNIKNQKQGTIDVYTYGDSELRVAVEYCSESDITSKTNSYYFAFNNPQLNMITQGQWEINIYPHCPMRYQPRDIIFIYFIEFDSMVLQCEIVSKDGALFTYIHRKTTPLKNRDKDIIYSLTYSPRPNYKRNILRPVDNLERKISYFFLNDKVFYQDNEIGEIVRNYLISCKNSLLMV